MTVVFFPFVTIASLYCIAPLRDEEDELLQMAIQQSLVEYQQTTGQDVQPQITAGQTEDDDLQR